jgi:hypothetical protein
MRAPVSVTAAPWLSAPPNPVTNPGQVLAGFSATPRVFRYRGPHRFYRAAGKDAKGRMASAYGGWWVDETVLMQIYGRLDQYKGWLDDRVLKSAMPAQYRALTALCEDWNDMREVFVLELPGTDEVEAIAGPTKPQPQRSSLNPALPTTPMLRGGAEQIFMKVKNPLWVHIARPF